MRNCSKGLIFSLLFISILFPILPGVVKAQETIPVFTVGACGPRSIYHWDPTAYVASTGDYYLYNALENLYDYPYNAKNGSLDNLVPILATNWSIHERPDEMNDAGFMNYDGIDYMDITLRENVTFHDGSDWNATVCKWNIDRLMYILGNINFCLGSSYDSNVRNTRPIYWMSIADWAPYATSSWNVTKLRGPLAPFPYSAYGYLSTYPGFGNSHHYDIPLGYNRVPRFTNVTILDDQQSGGTLRVYFNDWGTGPQYLANLEFISMASYEDYFGVPILSYGDHPSFPQDDPATFPGHLIGTGSYIFEGHVGDTGTMKRFDNWWNTSLQQAEGWHTVPNVALTTFDHSATGYTTRTLAIVTGDIDWAFDRSWEPLGYSDIIATPGLRYVDMGTENYGEIIVLNCLEETYLRYWSDIGFNITKAGIRTASDLLNPDGTITAHGVNRTLRKAISYAFDYDKYLSLFGGRVVRSGGFLAPTHEYYDASIPLAYTNLTIARQALLDDPFWLAKLTARGLDIYNTTDEWNDVANSNPIYTFEYHYDDAHLESYSVLTTSLADIGCAIDATQDWPDTFSVIVDYKFPIFTNDGFAIKPYHARFNDLGYIEAYYESTGVIERVPINSSYRVISDYNSYPYMYPYKGYSNMNFNYNATCDSWITKLWFQNSTGDQIYYSALSDWTQNFQYPIIYLGNDRIGHAVSDDWDYAWWWNFMLHFNLVKYTPYEAIPVLDPFILGLISGLIIGVGGSAIVIVANSFIRKKRSKT